MLEKVFDVDKEKGRISGCTIYGEKDFNLRLKQFNERNALKMVSVQDDFKKLNFLDTSFSFVYDLVLSGVVYLTKVPIQHVVNYLDKSREN